MMKVTTSFVYSVINLILAVLYGGIGISVSLYSIGRKRGTSMLNIMLVIGDVLIILGSYLNFTHHGMGLAFLVSGIVLIQVMWILWDFIMFHCLDLRHQVVALIIAAILIITYYK